MQEVEIGRITVPSHPGKKVCLSQWEKMGAVAYICHPITARSTNRRISIQAGLGKKHDPVSKITRAEKNKSITRAERTGDMVQAIECLPKQSPEFKP
jgi:hypothetical protein